MDIISILKTIQEDWVIITFFFTLGGAWIQGKSWFDRVNKSLEKSTREQGEMCDKIDTLQDHIQHMSTTLTAIESKQGRIESQVDVISSEIHQQEIKLAVLDSRVESNHSGRIARKQ